MTTKKNINSWVEYQACSCCAVVDVSTAAMFAGVSRQRVEFLIASGRLEVWALAGRYVVPVSSLRLWLDTRKSVGKRYSVS